MTTNDSIAQFLAQLEPKVAKVDLSVVRFHEETLVQLSLAISIKRIADRLDAFYEQGVSIFEK